MNVEEFRLHGKEMVDYICRYLGTIETKRVVPNVGPGYLANLMPDEAPDEPEQWSEIMADVDKLIMPGITHWQHPRFHAYFPSGNSFPSIMGEMISSAFACIGFSWVASPAYAELEMIMCDWLAKMMNMPLEFLHNENIGGGGVIQGSASDSILVSLLAARHKIIKEVKSEYDIESTEKELNIDALILTKLTGYCSSLAHSCVEKSAMISFVKMRHLEVDDAFSMRGDVLEAAILRDKASGLLPFFVCATLGTTACCSFDNLEEIADICVKYKLWLHVDAAYAGSSFICPEFQYLLKGIEYVDSFNFNPNKLMLINFDCSILWVRNSSDVTDSMIVNPVYLQHKHSSKAVDFRHWGIPLSRRFRSLKIWFTIRTYGVTGLQEYIRNHVKLAKEFECLVKKNKQFEIVGSVTLGLVCFRLKEMNSINQCLIRAINESGLLHMTPSVVKDKYILRFCVCNEHAKSDDIVYAWGVINRFADEILITQNGIAQWRNYLNENNNPNRKFHKAAEKLVDSVLNSKSIDEQIRKHYKTTISESKDSNAELENDNVTSNVVEYLEEEEEEEEEEEFEKENGASNSSDLKEEEEDSHVPKEVFVCESDLGVGINRQNTLTKLRRQTLLKMISDPTVYNQRFFKSYCLCDDVRYGNKFKFAGGSHCKAANSIGVVNNNNNNCGTLLKNHTGDNPSSILHSSIVEK